MRFKVLCCEVFFREICHLAAETKHQCDLEFLPKGLHDLGVEKMVPRLQERIDAVQPDRYDATLLVYGLCNNGIVGLRARHCRLVIPRAHDCITLFLGSRARYQTIFNEHPGTYYRTSGWIERNDSAGADDVTVSQRMGLFRKYEELVEKYGEDNAKYIMETMGSGTEHYDTLGYISMGLTCDAQFRDLAEKEAAQKGWTFKEIPGSLTILRKLLSAEWDADFLLVEPSQVVGASHDQGIVKVVQQKGS